MSESKQIDILDYFVILVKWKKLFLQVAVGMFVVSYIGIYFFIDEEYEATAVIVPSEDKQLGGISSLMKNLGSLPIAGLKGSTVSTEMDLYVTVITSRTLQEDIIRKFNLLEEFGLESMEKALKRFKDRIKTKVTDENAFEIAVRGSSPQQSVEIANFVLERLNETIIQLNITKSKNNRLFLEERYNEVSANLRNAEDSLQIYQQSSGMLEVKEQTKLIVDAYTKLESELLTKQLELSILENTYSKDSPLVDNLKVQVKEYEKKIGEMKREGGKESVILALNSLPAKAKNYIRHYRDVEIYSAILEFLVPLYEQSKFEEQKNVPVLQVIDTPRLPEKKVYPPRTLFAAIITFGGLLLTYFYVLLQENTQWKENEKIVFIKQNLLQWKRN
ncbi:MAG: Wzz/FepE/Etk N-terminal domain-containing protein [Bacteroidota bacterium]